TQETRLEPLPRPGEVELQDSPGHKIGEGKVLLPAINQTRRGIRHAITDTFRRDLVGRQQRGKAPQEQAGEFSGAGAEFPNAERILRGERGARGPLRLGAIGEKSRNDARVDLSNEWIAG